jgi:hypothetical protein
MRDKKTTELFNESLTTLEHWARIAQASREAYRVKWAQAYLQSPEKTDTARKADADVECSHTRKLRDLDQIALDMAYHAMLFLRGPEVITRPEEE